MCCSFSTIYVHSLPFYQFLQRRMQRLIKEEWFHLREYYPCYGTNRGTNIFNKTNIATSITIFCVVLLDEDQIVVNLVKKKWQPLVVAINELYKWIYVEVACHIHMLLVGYGYGAYAPITIRSL